MIRRVDERHPAPTAAIIDSASVRGADTAPRRSRGYDAGKRVNGRNRHIAVNTHGLPLAVIVTIAGLPDRDAGLRLLAALLHHRPGLGRRRLHRAPGALGRVAVVADRADRPAH